MLWILERDGWGDLRIDLRRDAGGGGARRAPGGRASHRQEEGPVAALRSRSAGSRGDAAPGPREAVRPAIASVAGRDATEHAGPSALP